MIHVSQLLAQQINTSQQLMETNVLTLFSQDAILWMLTVGAVRFQEAVVLLVKPTELEYVAQRRLKIEIYLPTLENALSAIAPAKIVQELKQTSVFPVHLFTR